MRVSHFTKTHLQQLVCNDENGVSFHVQHADDFVAQNIFPHANRSSWFGGEDLCDARVVSIIYEAPVHIPSSTSENVKLVNEEKEGKVCKCGELTDQFGIVKLFDLVNFADPGNYVGLLDLVDLVDNADIFKLEH